MTDIHSNIRKFRKERKYTLEDLGKAIGVSRQTIQRYETGEISNIPYEKIVAMAKFMNVSPSDLMGWDTESPLYKAAEDAVTLAEYRKLNNENKKKVRSYILFLLREQE